LSIERQTDLRLLLPKLIICGDFNIRPGWTMGPRTIDDYEIVFFPAGSRTTYTANGLSWLLNEPSFIFTCPREEHAYIFDSNYPIRHLFAHFTMETPDLLPIRSIPPVIPADRLPHTCQWMKHLLLLAGTTPSRWRERASALLLAILEELSSFNAEAGAAPVHRESSSLPILKALEYMERHLHETFSIRDLAALTGWTHEYFTRMFVRTKGVPPKQYLLGRRLERACGLLRLQSLSVKEIAYSCGFQSEQYFSRAFAKMIGISPSKYRELNLDPRLLELNLAPASELSTSYPMNRYFGGGFA
jgi:AraC family transcriptional regulator